MRHEDVKRAYELSRNMKDFDKHFLLHLSNQAFPYRPYDYNAPYKKIRYTLNKYLRYGVLELNSCGYVSEITVHFTALGHIILCYIANENEVIK